jgi:aminopeptidase N
MLEVLLGREGFRRGMDRYVELFDGRAITTEDFLYAMESANNVEFEQFRRWYNQAGTPVCTVSGDYDADAHTFTLNVRQSCAPTADGSPKEPFYFPMITGLLNQDGNDMPLTLTSDESDSAESSRILIVDQPQQEFIFRNISEKPVPSLFRNFSAPVKVEYEYTREELMFLLHHDSDAFNRYDAGQRLALSCLLEMTASLRSGDKPVVADDVLDAFGSLIGDDSQDLAFCAHALVLPSVSVINQELEEFDFENTAKARETFKSAMAHRHAVIIKDCYNRYAAESYSLDSASVAKRRFRNLCLDYLSYPDDSAVAIASEQFHSCDNMTDRMEALRVLCIADTPERECALASFLERYRNDFNVTNKWFGVQASAVRNPNHFDNVLALTKHDLFDSSNPNRLRSVYGAFAGCLSAFHDVSGRGYRLIADVAIETDPVNCQISAGFGKAFKHYAHLPDVNREKMKTELERIAALPEISTGLQEVVTKTLS